jgi:hypothetical protein
MFYEDYQKTDLEKILRKIGKNREEEENMRYELINLFINSEQLGPRITQEYLSLKDQLLDIDRLIEKKWRRYFEIENLIYFFFLQK